VALLGRRLHQFSQLSTATMQIIIVDLASATSPCVRCHFILYEASTSSGSHQSDVSRQRDHIAIQRVDQQASSGQLVITLTL